ncbi:CDGSH iron-sulfur domain-containing protein [Synechococcus sp. BS56D]|jgi:CDGSH-type Zn-finger protein|uniref:CDGSH iron-sulfur domain-containing protein n=1 Tax=Synechococcus sp. BS56D TaxID=2055944 RepID=UPI00103DC03D|nr:CDGSH iron-sulfur domain-containing protein [Synechococcus sp. BS56D]TCD58977.1 CDGSH iron-sulfur domain-containing protein [Synechococcus sp. BS56D]
MPQASNQPTVLALDAGTHALCTCGLSQNGAFCDGSHQGTDKTPHILKLDTAKTIVSCSCGSSSTMPFCDGSHSQIGNTQSTPWWKFWA